MYFLNWASQNEELTVVGMVGACVISVFVVNIVFANIRRIWIGHRQLELKQAMIEQGMSVEEIQEVMRS